MIKLIDVNQRVEFSFKDDLENKTIFVLKPLSGIEMMEFSEATKDDVLKMVLKSVVEVRNLDNAGSVLDVINGLDIYSIGQLINKINEINHITRQDQKN